MRGVIILSGGLDSTVLLYYIKKNCSYMEGLYTITYDYGQKHKKEIEMAEYQAEKAGVLEHKIIDISFIKDLTKGASALTDESIKIPSIKEVLGHPQPITYVPNRNMILLSIAVGFAEARKCDYIFYGAQAHDTYSGYWDASPEFLPKINEVVKLNRKNKISIIAPFINYKKYKIVQLGKELGVDFSKTWTCYKGLKKACGVCPTCADRIKAFMDAGEIDPLEYDIEINWRR